LRTAPAATALRISTVTRRSRICGCGLWHDCSSREAQQARQPPDIRDGVVDGVVAA
jgi:hypothetical protein